MNVAEATAEVFVTAFESLARSQQQAVLRRLLASPRRRQDILDVAVWLDRKKESSVPYETVRRKWKKAGRL
jgi:hypothetical protein